ncbi:hypothetical protein ABH926_004515 [Catenulispora sp. GP43]|uniref:hypothetical protein n=1 Tax=Catenulispora sp. GP43 TaxID=3156263 RepID=UPI003513BFBF
MWLVVGLMALSQFPAAGPGDLWLLAAAWRLLRSGELLSAQSLPGRFVAHP